MAVDEHLHKAHGAADHQQNIKVQRADDLIERQHTGDDEDHTGSQGDVGAVLTGGQHQYIGSRKEDNGR